MSLFLRDLRYGARALLHAPWYALTVVTVLAIGIGLATVAFAIADGVLFKPLPYDRAAELFLVHPTNHTQPTRQPPPASWSEIEAWREAVPDLELTASPMARRSSAAQRSMNGSSKFSGSVRCSAGSPTATSPGFWSRSGRNSACARCSYRIADG